MNEHQNSAAEREIGHALDSIAAVVKSAKNRIPLDEARARLGPAGVLLDLLVQAPDGLIDEDLVPVDPGEYVVGIDTVFKSGQRMRPATLDELEAITDLDKLVEAITFLRLNATCNKTAALIAKVKGVSFEGDAAQGGFRPTESEETAKPVFRGQRRRQKKPLFPSLI